MLKSILLTLALVGCSSSNFDATSQTLVKGACYRDAGDYGGEPDIRFCVHASGRDGFLYCQGSTSGITGQFRWYACGNSQRYKWVRDVTVVECPSVCTGNEK